MNSVHDRIAGTIALLGSKYNFPADTEKIHRAFYQICEKGLFDKDEFRFRTGGDFPKSPILESIIDNLCISRLIECMGPDMKHYQVSASLHNHYARKGKLIL